MKQIRLAFLVVFVVLIGARGVLAQAPPAPRPPAPAKSARPIPRAYFLLGGGSSLAQNDFADESTTRTNAEDGSYKVAYEVKGAPGIDASAGVRVWRAFGVRLGVGRTSTDTPAAFTVSSPHPFFFGRPRTASATIDGLKREETTVDLHLLGMFPVSSRVVVTAFAGPSWLKVAQGTVQSFTLNDVYPYDSISFNRATTATSSASKAAFGGGVNVGVFLTKLIGLGVGVQFAQADLEIATSNGGHETVRAGGARITAGLALKIP